MLIGCSVFLGSISYVLAQPALLTMGWVAGCLLSALWGYFVFFALNKIFLYKVSLSELELRLTQAEVAAAIARHDCEQQGTLLNLVTDRVSGLVFRFEVPGFQKNGRFCYISERVADVVGQDPQAIMEQPELFLDCIHPDDRERFYASAVSAADSYIEWNCEFRMITSDPNRQVIKTQWLRASAQPNDARDRPLCLDGIFWEIADPANRVKESTVDRVDTTAPGPYFSEQEAAALLTVAYGKKPAAGNESNQS